jgi:WD40 repeat protein
VMRSVWDLESGELKATLNGHTRQVSAKLPLHASCFLETDQCQIRRWGAALVQVTSVCATPDGKYIISGSADNTVR